MLNRRQFFGVATGAIVATQVNVVPAITKNPCADIVIPQASPEYVRQYLETIKQMRGIYDYVVVCDDRNNTPEHVDNNELQVDVYIKPVQTPHYMTMNNPTKEDLHELITQTTTLS